MYTFVLIIHIILFLLAILFIGIVLSEKSNDTTKYLFATTISNVMVSMGYTQEIISKDMDFSMASVKIQLFGLVFLMSFLLFFVARCCNIRIPKVVRKVLMLVDVFFGLTALTLEFHSLFFTEINLYQGSYPIVVVEEGIVCKICFAYNVSLGLICSLFAVRGVVRNTDKKRIPMYLLPFCFLPTVIALILFFIFTPQKMGFNPVPASITVGMSYLIFMVYKFRLLDTAQVAKDSIVESINEIYLVVDVSKFLLFASNRAYEVLPDLRDRKKQLPLIEEIYRNNRGNMEINERQYQVSVSPFYDKKTLKGYSLWLFDKTEEIRNTKELIELKNRAEEANQAKSLFLANMSHEIRTPMNAILGTTEMILRSNPKPEVETMATDIKKAGTHLSTIISGILDFSKIESGQVESVEVNYDTGGYLKEVIRQFGPRIQQKGLAFPLNIDPTLPKGLRGDATHVRQILTNILDNAIKYTDSGFVSLILDWEEVDGRAKLNFAVEDTGCGIKEKAIPGLFDSFSRADLRRNRDIQGTGLGLAIAKRLVESLEGEITVESTYGSGTKFTFYVMQKIWDPAPMGDFSKVKEEGISEEKKEEFIAPEARVLCVDDNLTNRRVIQELLSIYRISADVAESGAACLKILEKDSRYHLIFMDQMMPEMDGIETAKAIRTMHGEVRRIPIVALTANAVVGAREMFLENGFQDYLAKPIELKELEKVLRNYLPEKLITNIEEKENEEEMGKPIVIPGVDTKEGMKRVNNERARYLKSLRFLYDDGEKQIDRMKKMLLEGKIQNFGFEAHAVKGLTLGIGAKGLSEMAKEMEFAAKEDKKDIIQDKSKAFFKSYEMLLANIRYVLKENGISLSENEIKAIKGALTEGEFVIRCNDILDALDLLEEQEAGRLVEELLRTNLPEDRREALKKARTEISDFEYDSAAQTIEALLTV